MFQYKYRVNISGSTVQTSEQLVKSTSLEYVNNYAFLCIVMRILLIISGIDRCSLCVVTRQYPESCYTSWYM
jgi:hypothetical protein